ncbi:hypothetical protein GCM10025863_01430 [Microbacterium suwonense]|uniref:ABC transporter permease n=1 Tax=Microbacterium suwonense TaxID=683047 RepID=A0ABN6WYL9_9MICO|nr:hypothetical protein GCM10025863_01430 [Microbacterium suwonense]
MTQTAPTSALDLAAEFLDRRTPVDRIRGVLHRYPAISPAVVLVVAVIVFGVINPRFFAAANLSLVLDQVSVVGTVAIAQTLIILTAGIDLSVGALMIGSSMVMAQTAANNGLPAPIALLMGLIAALAAGALNGVLVTQAKLPPFIATLGTFNVFIALTLLYSGGQTVRKADMPELLTWTATALPIGESASPSEWSSCWRCMGSSHTFSAAPHGADTSTPSAMMKTRLVWPASHRSRCC